MVEARLSTKVWVDALIRRAEIAGASAFVVQKGDTWRGDVLIKVADLSGGGRVYSPRINMDGARVFVDLVAQGIGPDESGADAYMQRAKARDPDLWVIEIEDRSGRHFLTETVEEMS